MGKTLENLDEATFNAQFHINVEEPFFLEKAAAPGTQLMADNA